MLDDKIDKARFGYVVSRKKYYNDLIKEMDDLTQKLGTKIDDSNSLF